MDKVGNYLLLVEKSTYYVDVIGLSPLTLILNGLEYVIRDDILYLGNEYQGRVYNWMYAELSPRIDIVMRERESLLNSKIGEYLITRIVHHLHTHTLYDICRDGVYKQMLINDNGRFISSPNGWMPFEI